MRAKPYITCGLLAGALTLPVSVFALGLGKLTVQSGLGQPLSATIELTSAQKDELDTLRARIADPAVYRDNNVQYPAAMSRARIVVEQTANGAPYLRVTTSQAVNDAFLDLLVELNWATGRVVRDYTFLLDPPSGTETQAVEPTAPIRAQAGSAAAARAQGGATGAAAAPAARRSAAAAPAEAPSAAASTYTVKRGDTLSKIAQQTKPADVSLEQMLVALFRSNESAFEDRNMNRLRTGQIVNVPQGDQVAAIAPSEATQVVRAQAADWRAYRDRVAGAAPAADATAPRQSASGRITTAVEDKAGAAQPGKDQLRVSREAGKGAAAGTALAEDLAAKERALSEANSRVAELEKTVRDLQRAVELKNQTMSSLQPSAEASKGKGSATPAEAPKVAAATPAPAATAPAPTPAPAPSAAAPPPAAAAPTVAAPTAAAPTVATSPPASPAPETKAPSSPPPETKAPEAKAETKATPPKPAPPKKAPAKPEPSFIDDLFGNTPTWAIGGGALVLLAGIAGIVAARRRKTTRFEDSIISGTDIKTNTVFGSTGGGVVNTGDNSLASDFSREGLGNIDTDEVDPIAEAEVYLAYGRDAQAEEILKDALKKDPQRQEIYLKLLEIHSQHNKPSAFETVASELYSVSGGQGEVWQKAMALGRQLDPANPLFTEAGGSAFAATPAAAAAAAAAEPPVSDTQVFSVPPEHKAEPRVATPLDFSLDDDISLAPSSGEEPKTPAAILAGAAQEVAKSSRAAGDSLEKSSPFPGTVSGAAKSGASDRSAPAHDSLSLDPESVPKFDLDFHLDEPVRAAPPAAQPKPAPAPEPAPEPERAFATAGAPAPQLARPAAAIELDKLDLAFDPDRSTFEDPTPSVLDGQWHDAATKLDLAKAYQEMGDVEGAREILQEVLHEGDDEQKTEAKTLLSKLA